MIQINAYAAQHENGSLSPCSIRRRELLPDDVRIKIFYCGVCHSDVHAVRNEWSNALYPMVPGHEIVGTIEAIGEDVSSFSVGDLVGVGCMVDSCGECGECFSGNEQFCDRATMTYNSIDSRDGTITLGGFSSHIVVREKFVLHLPAALDLPSAAPLLCAGLTTFSALRHWGVGAGSYVGIVGCGGLGHLAVKLARAMGAKVILFTTSPDKQQDAFRLGAEEVMLTGETSFPEHLQGKLDLIVDTVSSAHALDAYMNLLRRDGSLVMLGGAPTPHHGPAIYNLSRKRRHLAGSVMGSLKETREMLEFCALHDIHADVEIIDISRINEAFARVLAGDVRYRYVVDLSKLHVRADRELRAEDAERSA